MKSNIIFDDQVKQSQPNDLNKAQFGGLSDLQQRILLQNQEADQISLKKKALDSAQMASRPYENQLNQKEGKDRQPESKAQVNLKRSNSIQKAGEQAVSGGVKSTLKANNLSKLEEIKNAKEDQPIVVTIKDDKSKGVP